MTRKLVRGGLFSYSRNSKKKEVIEKVSKSTKKIDRPKVWGARAIFEFFTSFHKPERVSEEWQNWSFKVVMEVKDSLPRYY
mmetsp:Transcript_8270/g.12380  ORF Transcript_8270/g.12380 Transcript_8270/m.12380 type:complete len:81 (+) Transcript_8270:349-591(+)